MKASADYMHLGHIYQPFAQLSPVPRTKSAPAVLNS